MLAPLMQGAVTMQINPLSDVLGAEVVGIDVANLDDAAFAAIHTAFLENLILVFRDQSLEPEAQIAFSERFGPIESRPDKMRPSQWICMRTTNSYEMERETARFQA